MRGVRLQEGGNNISLIWGILYLKCLFLLQVDTLNRQVAVQDRSSRERDELVSV